MIAASLIPVQYKVIAGALALVLAAGAAKVWEHHIFATGAASVQAKWDAAKLAASEDSKKAILAAVAVNDAAHETDIKQTQKVIKNYEVALDIKNDQITVARAAADHVSLRIDRAAICGRVAPASVAGGPVSVDGAGAESGTVELPGPLGSSLRDIASDADREVADQAALIDALRAWIVGHGFYGAVSAD
jgi:hypothetical protein